MFNVSFCAPEKGVQTIKYKEEYVLYKLLYGAG